MTECVRALLAVTALMSVVSTAHAEPNESGYYGAVFVGNQVSQSTDFHSLFGTLPTATDPELEGGFVVGGALGRSWSGLGDVVPRTELSLSYRQNESDSAGLVGSRSASDLSFAGDSASTALVGKIMLDVPLGESVLTPYLGAGVGVHHREQGFTAGSGLPLDGTSEDYSAQVMAGVSHSLADQLDLSVDGRYQRSLDDGGLASGGNAEAKGDDLGIFSFFVQLRAKF